MYVIFSGKKTNAQKNTQKRKSKKKDNRNSPQKRAVRPQNITKKIRGKNKVNTIASDTYRIILPFSNVIVNSRCVYSSYYYSLLC